MAAIGNIRQGKDNVAMAVMAMDMATRI